MTTAASYRAGSSADEEPGLGYQRPVQIGVVIPFFQRKSGLLRQALKSVLLQKMPDNWCVRIVVVDDGSPAPLEQDIANLILPTNFALKVIHQANGGPGAARNTGLCDLASGDVEFIAFLDSDDEWLPTHLSEAIEALGSDSDFFFSDYQHFSHEKSWLSMRIDEFKLGHPKAFYSYSAPSNFLLKINSSDAMTAFAEDCFCQTSTVVMRSNVLGDVRFNEDLKGSSEDLLYWFDCAKNLRSAIVSLSSSVRCGHGVNVYYNNLSWNSPQAPDRYGYFLLYCFEMRSRRFFTNVIRQRSIEAQKLYAYLLIRTILKYRKVNLSLLGKILKKNPVFAFFFPLRLIQYYLMVANRGQRKH